MAGVVMTLNGRKPTGVLVDELTGYSSGGYVELSFFFPDWIRDRLRQIAHAGGEGANVATSVLRNRTIRWTGALPENGAAYRPGSSPSFDWSKFDVAPVEVWPAAPLLYSFAKRPYNAAILNAVAILCGAKR